MKRSSPEPLNAGIVIIDRSLEEFKMKSFLNIAIDYVDDKVMTN